MQSGHRDPRHLGYRYRFVLPIRTNPDPCRRCYIRTNASTRGAIRGNTGIQTDRRYIRTNASTCGAIRRSPVIRTDRRFKVIPGVPSDLSGSNPDQETPVVTPSVDKVPLQDTPAPPVSGPTTVPTPRPSSQEPASTGPRLAGKVVLVEAQHLFSQRGLVLEPEVAKVSVFGLDGFPMADGGHGDSFSFNLPAGAAYLLKAKTVDGAVLWALTPVLSGDTTMEISLETTYQTGLIYAAEGKGTISGRSVADLKEQAKAALDVEADRLVNTVKRVVNNGLLWRVDYSIFTEMNEATLRAFGGGGGCLRCRPWFRCWMTPNRITCPTSIC